MIRLWTVQEAIYECLSADTELMGMVTGIVDEPEQNSGYPFIVIGEVTGAADDILLNTGGQQTDTMHVWDTGSSIKRTKQILDRMAVVLHNCKLSLDGTQQVACQVEFNEAIRDVDTLHGIMRVRVITFG